MVGDRKKRFNTIAEKNRTIGSIIELIDTRENFLLLGHTHPDDDCIASLVGFALILSKFGKAPVIYLSRAMSTQYEYMLNICRYNSIRLVTSFDKTDQPTDVIVILDTPKPDMIDANAYISELVQDEKIIKVEIDHHLGADGAYCGSEGYCLVTEASSAAELVGHLAMKINGRPDLLLKHQISDLFSRNLVLSLLTGIIADSNMGKYLKSRRERRHYEIFSTMFNTMLAKETVKSSNYADMNQLFSELRQLTTNEDRCFNTMLARRRSSQSIGYVVFGSADSVKLFHDHDHDTVVSVSRTVADRLAEDSGKLGLVCYFDDPKYSNLVQFRLRRNTFYKAIDLREVLVLLEIENGGGHEGAVGFRFSRDEVDSLERYVSSIIPKIESAVAAAR